MKLITRIVVFSGALFILAPGLASAHQPRIVDGEYPVVVENPEVSKAYYGKLTGEPAVYKISSGEPFELYVNVLVPDLAHQKKDVSAAIIKDGEEETPLAVLEGINFSWEKFFEEYGHDTYWKGPEYKNIVPPGSYEIRVWSSNNDSKYSLAVGSIELFDAKESMNALNLIPKLKKDFFEESPVTFIFSPIGAGYLVLALLLGFLLGLLLRVFSKKIALYVPKNATLFAPKNIGKNDRIVRAVLGVGFLVFAVVTTWSPVLLIAAGFCIFEAMFSWCGFYAILGRNTCPLE